MKSRISLLLFLVAAAAHAAVYDVGPGKPLASVSAVPWNSLAAGDTVLIHWRETPYREKWVICRVGTEAAPITVRGVPNRFGELPVIDGAGAVTASNLNYWGEERGVIKIGGANTPPDAMPAHIVIENLDILNARPPFTFTGDDLTVRAYASNASAVYIERGHHIALRNCILRSCGNGLFAGADGGVNSNLLIEGCYIYDNGNTNSIYEHNNYTEVNGITFQYNCFGPLRAGCSGNNLKDRSAGTVIRYNWIEAGNRQLDLVDSDYYQPLAAYSNTYVYGNVLVEPGDVGNSQIAHYGGDSTNQSQYRKGRLHFFHNTVISKRSANTTLLRLSSNEEYADCRNNIVYVTADGSRLAMLDQSGHLDLANNWFKTGWVSCHGTLDGTITNLGGILTGAAPGFVDEASADYHLAAASPCIGHATGSPAAVVRQYVKRQWSEPRPDDGAPDIGAFEWAGGSTDDDLAFLHHSCGANWLNNSLDAALIDKDFIDERNDIYYGTDMAPQAGRPDSLAPTPGDNTDMNHWILWFNDYLATVRTFACADGTNRIIMFKSCYPNSDVYDEGAEPGDPFSGNKTLANYKALYRHPAGPGGTYTNGGYAYRPLEDIFAANPDLLFVPVAAPPLNYGGTTDDNAHRARLFNEWLKADWLNAYNAAHPELNNVAVFDWFDYLAYADDHTNHPNRLKGEYGGATGDAHPNNLANTNSTWVFAARQMSFIDRAWRSFRNMDDDADHMPDWWEFAQFLSMTGSDLTTDFDHDEALDWQEYTAGASPTNPLSRFAVGSIGPLGAGGVTVRWPSYTNRVYEVQAASNVLGGFEAVASNLAALPPENTFTDLAGSAGSMYRIRVDVVPRP